MPINPPPVKHSTNKVHWLANFMRHERVTQGLTQMSLALSANIHPSSVAQYEDGSSKLSVLRVIENVLDVLGYELYIKKKGYKEPKT